MNKGLVLLAGSILVGLSAVLLSAGEPESTLSRITEVSLRALDLNGTVHRIGVAAGRPSALVFLGTECPISNRYVPVLNELAKSASAKNLELLAVVSDPTLSRAAVKEYRDRYSISMPVVFDASGELARTLRPAAVPEAFVINATGSVIYHGRIDDLNASVARQKEQADHHELADAIEAVTTGQPVAVGYVPAVGCVFEAWDSQPDIAGSS
jgi:thiol-disulfide isomerase/thioredoxin